MGRDIIQYFDPVVSRLCQSRVPPTRIENDQHNFFEEKVGKTDYTSPPKIQTNISLEYIEQDF